MLNAYETALLIAVLVKRSGERRVRVSVKTVKMLGRRKQLRSSFIVKVIEILSVDFGLCMVELDVGGFGVVFAKSLEAAKVALAKKFMADEMASLKEKRTLNWAALAAELDEPGTDDEEDAE